MAMQGTSNPAYDVRRLGQTNLTGDVRDLFLKLYAGEVLTAFEAKNIMMPLMRTRTITKGKSASFPFLGRTSAEYHTPGNEITGGKIRFIPFNKAGYDFSDLSYMDTLCGRGLSSTFIIVE